ncbi:putative MFS family arabinose efflux permease [Saccharothrix tamanrassetensis]|uniref:Putative MFS family arabinose efflux permease n=1 Tax=Saccharothrix tamanrassetensis TaxID=1051531 RepID=A0A841CJJ9_9PSEU|nr:MFS transporter [Saccharothrix tamanrassetensis]MBB5957651.1 putative MFS family arabinose efflux permease [Saccharothrix tamanrassetensis]
MRPAVFAVFLFNGALFLSWAARLPTLAAQVGAGEATLGLALLGASIGLAITAPIAARVCAAVGARKLVMVGAAVTVLAVPALSFAGSPLHLGVNLFVLGSCGATLDVGMNVAAVAVTRALDRPLMPQFHAGFSLGGLVGSLGAAAASAAGWGLRTHLVTAAVVGAVAMAAVIRSVPGETGEPVQDRHNDRSVVRRPLLWLLAGITVCSAIAEGATADWSALFFVRERELSEAVAAMPYAGFSIAMVIARLVGEPVQRRLGPYRLLGSGAVVAAAGLALAVLVDAPVAGFVGFALVGLGLSFGFPVVMDLAGDAGRRADGTGGEREIGLVTTVAYTGFLVGPPMVGGLAHVSSLSIALGVVAFITALIVPTAWLARNARARELSRVEAGSARP